MSELKWNWVYYPYLDAPNKQAESALKAGYIKVVIKDEADKVIADKDKVIADLIEKNKRLANKDMIMASETIKDLEESHKMEVEQLLMEIVELKAQKAQADDDCAYWKMSEGNAVTAMHETEEYAMQLYNELRHQKYKRCLAMGHRCQNAQYYFSVLQDNEASKINSNPKTFKELNRKCKFYARWRARWFMIADNFKEAK